jgi:hypothetical protein
MRRPSAISLLPARWAPRGSKASAQQLIPLLHMLRGFSRSDSAAATCETALPCALIQAMPISDVVTEGTPLAFWYQKKVGFMTFLLNIARAAASSAFLPLSSCRSSKRRSTSH